MSAATTIDIRLRINFPVIFALVVLAHVLFISVKHINWSEMAKVADTPQRVFKIKDLRNSLREKTPDIRTVGARDSQNKESVYLHKGETNTKTVSKDLRSLGAGPTQSNIARNLNKQLSFKDLAERTPPKVTRAQPEPQPQVRPGTRPGVLPQKPKAINAISLKGSQIHQFAQASDAMALSGDSRANPSLSNSDILVNLEVPEGVNPDELNKYELMFYSFQRRTAINYINSFFKNLDKFERENPHKQFPLTETKQVMTGRLTYDEKGNIKQIKMIRWTNVQGLQDFFENVLKDMDTLHNPPTALWKKDGEFSVFFSLVING